MVIKITMLVVVCVLTSSAVLCSCMYKERAEAPIEGVSDERQLAELDGLISESESTIVEMGQRIRDAESKITGLMKELARHPEESTEAVEIRRKVDEVEDERVAAYDAMLSAIEQQRQFIEQKIEILRKPLTLEELIRQSELRLQEQKQQAP